MNVRLSYTNVNRLLFRLPVMNLNLFSFFFLKMKRSRRVPRLKAGRVCAQAKSAQSDVTNRRYCAISAALRTRLSDLNTASLASPGRGAARGALEERRLGISSGDVCLWMSAPNAGDAPGHKARLPVGDKTRSRELPPQWNLGASSLLLSEFPNHKEINGQHAGRQSAEVERFLFFYWEFAGIGDAEPRGLRPTFGEEL